MIAIWNRMLDARGEAQPSCPRTSGPGVAPHGDLRNKLTERVVEELDAGFSPSEILARGATACACAAAKARRDRNMRHFSTVFDPVDWSRAMESIPSELEASSPSALAQGDAAKRRAAGRAPPLRAHPPKTAMEYQLERIAELEAEEAAKAGGTR